MHLEKRRIQKIACVGEVMIELAAAQDGTAKLGVAGDTYNTAVYLARDLRRAGISVSYVTALGCDSYSDRIIAAMSARGIDAGHTERRPGMMPGLYAIDTDERGERSFSYWRSDSAARTLFSEPCEFGFEVLEQFDMVLLSGITMAILPSEVRSNLIRHLRAFSRSGGTFVYDSNFRPALWESVEAARQVSRELWQIADIALPSLDDEIELFGEAGEADVIRRLRAVGVERGALKRGSLGPRNLSGPQPSAPLGPVKKVVDSTAAGDSFNAGYLGAVAQGHGDDAALAAGHALASHVVGFRGAIVPEAQCP